MQTTIKQISQVINEVANSTFNFHPGPDHLVTMLSSPDRYWRIGIRIKQDDTDGAPYAFITYQLRIGEKEFHLSPDSIGFDQDAVSKTMEYSRRCFISIIERLSITI